MEQLLFSILESLELQITFVWNRNIIPQSL